MDISNIYHLNKFKDQFEQLYPVPFADIHSNMIITCKSAYILDCYIYNIIRKAKINTKTNKLNFESFHCDYNEKINIIDCYKVQKVCDLLKYIKTTIQSYHIFKEKHLFVMKDIDYLNRSHQHTIFTLSEKYIKNCIFVYTTTKSSKIYKNIYSLNLNVIIPIYENTILENILKVYFEKNDIDVNIKTIIKNHNNDLFDILLNCPFEISSKTHYIHNQLSDLLNNIKKCKNIDNFITKCRDCIYKYIIFNIQHPMICQYILDILLVKYKKSSKTLHYIIHQISILEKTLLICSKPIYHYELFFLKLLYFINNN
jgi:hypothetical protein